MKRWVLVVGVVLALVGWWLWPRPVTVATLLPDATVSVLHLRSPAQIAQRLAAIADGLEGRLGSLAPWLDPQTRQAGVGLDPAGDLASLGLGPRGAAMARLTGIEPGVLCLDLADKARFAAWLGDRAQQPVAFTAQTLTIGQTTLPLYAAGDWICLSRADVPPADLAAAFAADSRLADAPLWAALNARTTPSYAGWSARPATRWAHARQRTTLATDLGHLAAYVRAATAGRRSAPRRAPDARG